MKAIITAAGQGKRLRPYTDDRPKSIVELGGRPMILYTLDILSACGIKEAVIVIGYHAEKYREMIGDSYKDVKITYVENKDFATTDNMTSLWMARGHIDKGYVFFNADVLVEKQILKNLLDNPHENVCVIDDGLSKLSKTGMLMKVENDKIVSLGRGLPDGNARAIGMYKYSAEGANAYFKEIGKLMESDREMLQIEQPMELFLKHHDIYAERVAGLFWEEIDDEKDLRKAEKNLLMLAR